MGQLERSQALATFYFLVLDFFSSKFVCTMFLAPVPLLKLSKSPEKIRNSSILKKFPVKFWRLINSCKSNAVCWGYGGNSVRILKEKFEEEYLHGENRPFKTITFSSFVRQLNLYGFRKVVRPVITNEHGQKLNTSLIEYRHPMFLKGHPELLPRIKRNTKSLKQENGNTTTRVLKRKMEDTENGEELQQLRVNQCEAKECRNDNETTLHDIINHQASSTIYSDPKFTAVTSACGAVISTGQSVINLQGVQQPIHRDPLQSHIFGSFTANSIEHTNRKPGHVHPFPAPSMSYQLCSNNLSVDSGFQSKVTQQNNLPLNLSKKVTGSDGDVEQFIKVGTVKNGHFGTVAYLSNDAIRTVEARSESPRSNALVPPVETHHTSMQRSNVTQEIQDINTTVSENSIAGPQDGSIKESLQTVPTQQVSVGQKTIRGSGVMIRGAMKGQSVLYLNPHSSFLGQLPQRPAADSITLPGQKPIQARPQPVLLYNIPKAVSQNTNSIDSLPLSASCEDVASHPLLQPVRQDYKLVQQRFNNGPLTTNVRTLHLLNRQRQILNRQRLTSSSCTRLPSIPESDPLPGQVTVQAQSADHDVLSDLPLFKLSSDLKDIDDPNQEQVNVAEVPEFMDVSCQTRDETPSTTDKLSTNQKSDSSKGSKNITASGDKSIEVQLIECTKSGIAESSSGFMETPRTTDPQPEVKISSDALKSSGPRRELFKEKITRRITIPLSGLPKDLFSLGTVGSDQNKAVVTIETLEDGRITGHLILPGKEVKKSFHDQN